MVLSGDGATKINKLITHGVDMDDQSITIKI